MDWYRLDWSINLGGDKMSKTIEEKVSCVGCGRITIRHDLVPYKQVVFREARRQPGFLYCYTTHLMVQDQLRHLVAASHHTVQSFNCITMPTRRTLAVFPSKFLGDDLGRQFVLGLDIDVARFGKRSG